MKGIAFNNLHDTMLMGRVFLNENKALKDLAGGALGLELDKTLQVSDWNRPELLQEQMEYGAADAVVALELARIFEQWFAGNEPHYREAYVFLRSLIYPIARQLSQGVPFDMNYHNQLIAEWERARDQALRVATRSPIRSPPSIRRTRTPWQPGWKSRRTCRRA